VELVDKIKGMMDMLEFKKTMECMLDKCKWSKMVRMIW